MSNSNPIPTLHSDSTTAAVRPEAESAVADLVVASGDEIKGGPSGSSTSGGSTRLNHNEPTAQDEDVEPELPADLPPVADDEVKGGPSGSCTSGGSTRLNHNESVSFDDSM